MPATPDDLFAFLDEMGIKTETMNHPAVFTVEESKSLRGEIPGAHVKNLFIKDKYTPLFESRLVAVCSPNLLKNQTPLANPRDVARFTLLELYTAAGDWDAWLGPGGRSGLGEAASIRFDSYLLALEAACDGQGIALAPDFLAEPDLASGRLVSPIRHSVPQPARWYLVARQDRADELAIGRFRDWLLKEVEPLRRS
jgi:LysR family glycine cleavage system transcriptional activator